MRIVVSAEDVAVSANIELDSAALNSKTGSEEVKIPVLVASNNDKQQENMKNSPQDTSQNSKDSISASNKDDKNAESKAEIKDEIKLKTEEGIKSKLQEKKEDPLDEAYTECKGHLSCVEGKIVTLVDRLDAMKSIPMFEGYVTIEKTSEEVPENDVVRDSDVALLSRLNRYLRSHSIRVHIPETEGDIPLFLGRGLQERFLDFNLGMLVTNDASEGQ
jgi:hypothetical protein